MEFLSPPGEDKNRLVIALGAVFFLLAIALIVVALVRLAPADPKVATALPPAPSGTPLPTASATRAPISVTEPTAPADDTSTPTTVPTTAEPTATATVVPTTAVPTATAAPKPTTAVPTATATARPTTAVPTPTATPTSPLPPRPTRVPRPSLPPSQPTPLG